MAKIVLRNGQNFRCLYKYMYYVPELKETDKFCAASGIDRNYTEPNFYPSSRCSLLKGKTGTYTNMKKLEWRNVENFIQEKELKLIAPKNNNHKTHNNCTIGKAILFMSHFTDGGKLENWLSVLTDL